MKGGGNLRFLERGGEGILEKGGGGGVDLEKGRYDPTCQLRVVPYFIFYMSSLYGYGHKNPGGHHVKP